MHQKHFSVISGGITWRAALLAACLAATAQATSYNINTTNMGFVSDGNCGLREAIDAVNTQSARWGCPGPDGSSDGIFLKAGTYTAPVGMTLDRSVSINCPLGTCIVDAGTLNTNCITLSSLGPTVFINDITLRQSAGNTNNINGLSVLGGTVNLYHTVVTGFRGAGVSIQSGNNHSITRSTFTGNGFGLDLGNGTGFSSIQYNTISNNWEGIRAGTVGPFSDTGSVISNNADAGVEVPNGGSLAFTNTIISHNRNRGIHLGLLSSTLAITGCTIDGNTTSGDGAGIYVPGDFNSAAAFVQIYSSTISNNRAGGNGGGMYVTSTVNISNSTLSNDTAKCGGGAYSTTNSSNSYLLFTQCTVAFNRATDSGGGLACPPLGNGFRNSIGVTTSIVGRNTAGRKYPDMFGKTEGDHSLFGDTTGVTGDHSTFFPAADPLLGPLMDNAGPVRVKTHALLALSPAKDVIDPGFNNNPDSRGFPRPSSGLKSWDLGAYEAGPFETELLTVISQSPVDHRVQYESGLSNGAGTVLRAVAVGDSVVYAIAVAEPGFYHISLQYKAGPNRPIVALATSPEGAPNFRTIGSMDLYRSRLAYATQSVDSIPFNSAGIRYFRLKVAGQNVNSTGFLCYFDYIDIVKD